VSFIEDIRRKLASFVGLGYTCRCEYCNTGFEGQLPLELAVTTGSRQEKTMAVEENKKHDEAQIKRVIEDGVKAVRDRDIEGVMSLYAQEVVSFDIVPPLQYIGADAFRKPWEDVFSVYRGPIDYQVHDLNITVGDDVAFTHSLNRISGTLISGQKTDLWMRWTACFRKINGKWLIVHHQISVPVDLRNGKAVLDLKP
jgi:uncharacterized protein (TIGR02246 family)